MRSGARAARDRFISQVEERRNPRTSATVDQLLDRYLEHFDGAPKTLTLYWGYVRKHISPFLGHIKVGALDADVLDSFYAELRRCRDHCTGRRFIQHRTEGKHEPPPAVQVLAQDVHHRREHRPRRAQQLIQAAPQPLHHPHHELVDQLGLLHAPRVAPSTDASDSASGAAERRWGRRPTRRQPGHRLTQR